MIKKNEHMIKNISW